MPARRCAREPRTAHSGESQALRFAGQVAFVTGAAQGIGRAIALRLAAEGADLGLNDLDEASLAVVADTVSALGRRTVTAPADVGDVDAIRPMIERVIATLGRLDIVVNNAGILRPVPFGSISVEDWDVTQDVNARSVLFCSQVAADHLSDGGCIINIASTAARGTATMSPAYAASKAAILSITHATARALAPRGIRVNAVCPGIIDTAMHDMLDETVGVSAQGLQPGEFVRRRLEAVPLRRIGTPEDVAAVVSFLASSDAGYITAQSINVDGGLVVS